MTRSLVVMSKRPAAGATKTRLVPPLTGEQAANLYECFLLDALHIARSIPDIVRYIAYPPADGQDYFLRLAPDFGPVAQIGVGLGDRLAYVIEEIAHLGLRASVLGWNRANTTDIQTSLDCGVDAIAISLATSDIHIQTKLMKDRDWVIKTIQESVAYAKAKKPDLYVSVNAEDASRTEIGFLIEYAKAAKAEGADRIRFCDTIGLMEPFRTYEVIKHLREESGLEVEMHTHNDFGMAVANAIAGIHAGATWVNVTVGGLGERAGNAALEEVAMALKYIEGLDLEMDTTRFREIAEYVMKAAGRQIPVWKSVIGTNMFAHESGIHADGVIKNPKTYEVFAPGEVGLERQIVIGKHSGSRSLELKFSEYGIEVSREEAAELLPRVRQMAIELKRVLFDKELIYIYNDWKAEKKG